MKTPLFSTVLIVAFAGSASAAGGGINLGWLDCPNQGEYLLTRSFACDTNQGAHTLVGSFVAKSGMLAVSGYSAAIDVRTVGPALPSWWDLRSNLPAGCRAGSLSPSFDFTGGPFGCFDYWQGGAVGGSSANVPVGSQVRLLSTAALPAGDSRITPIPEGTEVYCFKLTINNAKTVGPGACGGCSEEACILLTSMLVTQVPGTPGGNFTFTNPVQSNIVLWQGWTTVDPSQSCPSYSPVRNRTWGAIKAVYR
jgi:hypothetical protein